MNKKRLLKLADLLDADATNRKGICFNFGIWADVDSDNPMSCGTTVCALGLAAISGAFKRQGLSYKIVNGEFAATFENKEVSNLTAASEVFDISIDDAHFLFIEPSRMTCMEGPKAEREVADKIRQFVSGKNF